MPFNYLVAVLTVVIGVSLSLFLVPRGKELALQNFRDRDYTEAQEAYEKRYAEGDRSADTLMPLAGLALDHGRVNQAIGFLEEYVARQPNELAAREQLGQLYKSAERMGDFLANFEEIVRLKPSFENIYELFSYYRFYGFYDRQQAILAKLVEVRPQDQDNAALLAQSLAAVGQREQARKVLEALDDRLQGKVDFDVRELLTALLIQDSQVEAAFQRTGRWLNEKSKDWEILALVNQMVAGNRSDLGYKVIKPYEARAASEESLALAMADLETVLGRLDSARLRLTKWAARGRIADATLGRFIALATNAGLTQLALDVVRDHNLNIIPDWSLVGLAETAFQTRDRKFLDRMVGELGDGFLSERPVLAGEIAIARDDKPGALRWARVTLADKAAPLTEHIAAVRQLVRADAPDEAANAFDRLALGGILPDEVVADLGSLFIDLRRVQAGFDWFEQRRRLKPSPAVDVGWARLAAREGDPRAVEQWLDRTSLVEGWVLQDIAGSASERVQNGKMPEAAGLALKAAERAYALTSNPVNATVLAGAYLANGRADDALKLIRPLLKDGGPAVEYIFTQALEALGLVEELTSFWSAKLANGLLSPADADAMLYAMLSNKSYAVALPYVRDRAETRGGDWIYVYADAARGAGGAAVTELLAFLDRRITEITDHDAQEKLVYLEQEVDRQHAARTLQTLTDKDPAHWWAMTVENLRELKRAEDIAVLLEHLIPLTSVTDAMREAMVYALIDAAGDVRALPSIHRLADAVGGPWDALYRELLTKLRRTDELRVYLLARAERPDLSLTDRRAIVYNFLDLKDKPAAVKVLKTLAADQGPDGEDVRQLYFLWGPRPDATVLDWMDSRAKAAATPGLRAAWYAKMVDMGAGDRVLTAIGGGDKPPENPALLRAWAEAKAAAKDADAVASAVSAAAKVERQPEALRRYARLAEQLRRTNAAMAAWSALLDIKPDDGDALRQLGFAAFEGTRYRDADRYLRQYLLRKPNDYEAWYIEGEALTLTLRKGEAIPLYETALKQLRATRGLPELARQTEAGILTRLGMINDAAAIYRDLLHSHPNDRRIRADFANMLIDNKRLEEAHNVLASR